jgi:hypothetical protein
MAARKNLAWLLTMYFWLLIGEGAVRKWILPGLSDYLLVVRDPLIIWIYLCAYRDGFFPPDPAVKIAALLGLISGLFGVFTLVQSRTGVASVLIAVYGVRTFFLHLPLIFLIPQVLGFRDVVRVGRWCLLLSVPMTLLMIAQYSMPAGHWLNKTTMGEGTEQIAAALGRIRPPGTFSFISGPGSFYPLVTAFLVFGILEPGIYSAWLKYAAAAATFLTLPISGSRTLVISCAVCLGFGAVVLITMPSRFARALWWGVAVVAAGMALLASPVGQQAVESFSARWTSANEGEGGGRGISGAVANRVGGGFTESFDILDTVPIVGYGIGAGTNVGSRLSTGEILDFAYGESEWVRILMELGPVLGAAYIFFRVFLCLKVLVHGWSELMARRSLSWLLAGACWIQLFNGQTGQPSTLGFMAFVGGLSLAAAKQDLAPVWNSMPLAVLNPGPEQNRVPIEPSS